MGAYLGTGGPGLGTALMIFSGEDAAGQNDADSDMPELQDVTPRAYSESLASTALPADSAVNELIIDARAASAVAGNAAVAAWRMADELARAYRSIASSSGTPRDLVYKAPGPKPAPPAKGAPPGLAPAVPGPPTKAPPASAPPIKAPPASPPLKAPPAWAPCGPPALPPFKAPPAWAPPPPPPPATRNFS